MSEARHERLVQARRTPQRAFSRRRRSADGDGRCSPREHQFSGRARRRAPRRVRRTAVGVSSVIEPSSPRTVPRRWPLRFLRARRWRTTFLRCWRVFFFFFSATDVFPYPPLAQFQVSATTRRTPCAPGVASARFTTRRRLALLAGTHLPRSGSTTGASRPLGGRRREPEG